MISKQFMATIAVQSELFLASNIKFNLNKPSYKPLVTNVIAGQNIGKWEHRNNPIFRQN